MLTLQSEHVKISPASVHLQGSPDVGRNPVAAFPEYDYDHPPLTDGRSVLETPGVWHVARVRWKHVKAYARDLFVLSRATSGAVNYMLPLRYAATVGSAGTRRRRYKSPLFPGTIFVCVADDSLNIDPNHRTIPSQNIVVAASSQARFRDDLVKVETMALTDPNSIELWPGTREGQQVRVLTGPYIGMVATIVRVDNHRRKLVVFFHDLQWASSVDLSENVEVEPI